MRFGVGSQQPAVAFASAPVGVVWAGFVEGYDASPLQLEGRKLRFPERPEDQPGPERLARHNEAVFRGR